MRAVLLLAAVGLSASASAQVNLITNGTFEGFADNSCPPAQVYLTGNTPAGNWSIERGTPEHLCSYISGAYGAETPHLYRADLAHSGGGYILLFGSNAGIPEAFRCQPTSLVRDEVNYTFSFWAKAPKHFDGGTFVLRGASGTTYAMQSVTGVNAWTGYSHTFTPTQDEAYLILTTNTGEGGVALDDLVLAPTSPLSLHIRWFDGAVRSNNAMLEWEMTEEHGLQSFSIERSLDGRGFQRIGHYAATTGFTTRYTLTDPAIPAGTPVFYRLRVIDIGGTSRYSRTLELQRPSDPPRPLTLSPNPARGGLKVLGFYEPARIRIFAADGRLMMTRENVEEGDVLDVASLPAGVYFLECRGAQHTVVERFHKD